MDSKEMSGASLLWEMLSGYTFGLQTGLEIPLFKDHFPDIFDIARNKEALVYTRCHFSKWRITWKINPWRQAQDSKLEAFVSSSIC